MPKQVHIDTHFAPEAIRLSVVEENCLTDKEIAALNEIIGMQLCDLFPAARKLANNASDMVKQAFEQYLKEYNVWFSEMYKRSLNV